MNPSVNEIRRRQVPEAFRKEVDWFAEGFIQPKTRLEISASTIDVFQSIIWDKSGDDVLSTYGKCTCFVIFISSFILFFPSSSLYKYKEPRLSSFLACLQQSPPLSFLMLHRFYQLTVPFQVHLKKKNIDDTLIFYVLGIYLFTGLF